MTLTSHELARQLLQLPDMPVYCETASEVDRVIRVTTDVFEVEEGTAVVLVGEESDEVCDGVG